MRLSFILCSLMVLFLLQKNASVGAEKVTLSTLHYPPYSIEMPDGQVKGFDADVIREAFFRMGRELEIQIFPWNRALQNTLNGVTAGVFSCSPRKNFLQTDAISTASDALFVRADHDFEKYPLKSIEDLKKFPELHVGGVSGYKQLKLLDDAGITYDTSPEDKVAFNKLFAGRIDVLLSIREYGEYRLKQLNLSHLAHNIPLRQKFYFICFNKSLPGIDKLISDFNAALMEMRKDGSYDAIHARYR